MTITELLVKVEEQRRVVETARFQKEKASSELTQAETSHRNLKIELTNEIAKAGLLDYITLEDSPDYQKRKPTRGPAVTLGSK